MKTCAKCGYKNEIDAKVCNLCGERLPATGDMGSAEPHALLPKSQSRVLNTKTIAKPDEPRHYLVPPFGTPFALHAGEAFTIGRDDASSLRLTTTKASRHHGEIGWKEGNPFVRDVGSQNGTWVNDKQLPAKADAPLRDGDSIQMADLIVTYRKLAPGVAEDALYEPAGTTQTKRTPSLKAHQAAAAAAAPDANLEGDAATFPIMDVLTKIAERNSSGILTVEVEGAKGELRIEDGKAVSAKYPGLEGPIAIQAIAALKSGRFRFQARREQHDTGKFSTLRAAAGGAAPAPGAPG